MQKKTSISKRRSSRRRRRNRSSKNRNRSSNRYGNRRNSKRRQSRSRRRFYSKYSTSSDSDTSSSDSDLSSSSMSSLLTTSFGTGAYINRLGTIVVPTSTVAPVVATVKPLPISPLPKEAIGVFTKPKEAPGIEPPSGNTTYIPARTKNTAFISSGYTPKDIIDEGEKFSGEKFPGKDDVGRLCSNVLYIQNKNSQVQTFFNENLRFPTKLDETNAGLFRQTSEGIVDKLKEENEDYKKMILKAGNNYGITEFPLKNIPLIGIPNVTGLGCWFSSIMTTLFYLHQFSAGVMTMYYYNKNDIGELMDSMAKLFYEGYVVKQDSPDNRIIKTKTINTVLNHSKDIFPKERVFKCRDANDAAEFLIGVLNALPENLKNLFLFKVFEYKSDAESIKINYSNHVIYRLELFESLYKDTNQAFCNDLFNVSPKSTVDDKVYNVAEKTEHYPTDFTDSVIDSSFSKQLYLLVQPVQQNIGKFIIRPSFTTYFYKNNTKFYLYAVIFRPEFHFYTVIQINGTTWTKFNDGTITSNIDIKEELNTRAHEVFLLVYMIEDEYKKFKNNNSMVKFTTFNSFLPKRKSPLLSPPGSPPPIPAPVPVPIKEVIPPTNKELVNSFTKSYNNVLNNQPSLKNDECDKLFSQKLDDHFLYWITKPISFYALINNGDCTAPTPKTPEGATPKVIKRNMQYVGEYLKNYFDDYNPVGVISDQFASEINIIVGFLAFLAGIAGHTLEDFYDFSKTDLKNKKSVITKTIATGGDVANDILSARFLALINITTKYYNDPVKSTPSIKVRDTTSINYPLELPFEMYNLHKVDSDNTETAQELFNTFVNIGFRNVFVLIIRFRKRMTDAAKLLQKYKLIKNDATVNTMQNLVSTPKITSFIITPGKPITPPFSDSDLEQLGLLFKIHPELAKTYMTKLTAENLKKLVTTTNTTLKTIRDVLEKNSNITAEYLHTIYDISLKMSYANSDLYPIVTDQFTIR